VIRRFLIAGTALGLLAAGAGTAYVYFGVYNVAATEQHTPPVYWLLNLAMRRAAVVRSEGIAVPPLDDAARIERGFALYRMHCVNCHGAPGVAPDAFALGMTPVPANLALAGRDWPAAEIYWVVRYGIKMTGMPAWEFRLNNEELWDLVAYVKHLPALSPVDYAARVRAAGAVAEQPQPAARQEAQPPQSLRGDAERGKVAMQQYACVSCHEVPGVTGAVSTVGPPLSGMAQRGFIGGVLPNTRENMVRWLRDPQAVDPRSAMPNLGVSMQHANDLAAYIETLE
jgi:mono/diheme cytochrome c family protein